MRLPVVRECGDCRYCMRIPGLDGQAARDKSGKTHRCSYLHADRRRGFRVNPEERPPEGRCPLVVDVSGPAQTLEHWTVEAQTYDLRVGGDVSPMVQLAIHRTVSRKVGQRTVSDDALVLRHYMDRDAWNELRVVLEASGAKVTEKPREQRREW